MKNPVTLLRNRVKGYPMRTKLAVSFSATIIAILFLTMIFLNFFITENYRETLLHTAGKSCDQAFSFLENYLTTLHYASDLVYHNSDLQSTLGAASFHSKRPYTQQYQEFLRLDSVFAAAEMVEPIYRARIFIPNAISYSNNIQHFAGTAELKARPDYSDFLVQSRTGLPYFTQAEQVPVPGRSYQVEIVSLLRSIRRLDGTAGVLAVAQISMRTDTLKALLEKSDITQTGLVYLVNTAGQIIAASGDGGELLTHLTQKGALLGHVSQGPDWATTSLLGEDYFVNQRKTDKANWTLVSLVPEKEITGQMRQIGAIILLLSLLAVAVVCVVSVFIARHYTRRLQVLALQMRCVQRGRLELNLHLDADDEIGELFQNFSYMTEKLKTLLHAQYESGRAVKSAELKALQAQINPHFLYNTLDLINWEAMDNGAPEIAEIAKSLARFYRISLNRGQPVVRIREELSHVQAYVDIENHHFDGAIFLSVQVPEALQDFGCLNIILQPLVENAIMHGIAENPAIQECHVSITAEKVAGDILFYVEDDGMGMDERQLRNLLGATPSVSHGYGVQNIHSRLQLSYGEDYGLSYESSPGQGTTVCIRIPARTPEEMQASS